MSNFQASQASIQDLAGRVLSSLLGHAQEQALRVALPADAPENHKVAWALLRQAFDHAVCISSIFFHHGTTLADSAFALLRPMNESLKRGAWIGLCAGEDKAKEFLSQGRKALPGMSEMVKKLEALPPFNFNSYLSRHHESSSELLHDFAHGGENTVRCYLAGQGIGANFSETDIKEALIHAEETAMLAVQVMAGISRNHDPLVADDVDLMIATMDGIGQSRVVD